jgi:hypothetical protein
MVSPPFLGSIIIESGQKIKGGEGNGIDKYMIIIYNNKRT